MSGKWKAADGRRWWPVFAAFALVFLAAGCNEELVVRVATRIFPDGSVARHIELAGRDEKGQTPSAPDWLESEAGVSLADPSVWRRVERAPGRISAEGIFASVPDLPACLRHAEQNDLRPAVDHCAAHLAVDDLVILKRYRYEERWTEPLGQDAAARALDRLFELAAELVREELRRQFGEGFDTRPAETFVRGEARLLTEETIAVSRRLNRSTDAARVEAWAAVLARHGLAVSPGEKFWSAQTPEILGWCRRKIAEALSSPERTISPEDLSFWPQADDIEETIRAAARRTWGDEEKIELETEQLVFTTQGWYSSSSSRYRFESRVTLPGRLLSTSGTPEGRLEATAEGTTAVRFFRGEDLVAGDVLLQAASVTINEEALRSLGARRELDARHLLQIVDLLTERDSAGLLVALLRRAVEKSRLDLLRKDQTLPKDLAPLARELADLLDPAVEPPFG